MAICRCEFCLVVASNSYDRTRVSDGMPEFNLLAVTKYCCQPSLCSAAVLCLHGVVMCIPPNQSAPCRWPSSRRWHAAPSCFLSNLPWSGGILCARVELRILQAALAVDPIMPCSTPCTPCKSSSPFSCNTSTSSSSMTWTTTFSDSKKPFTATRSMRFVVALYSVFRTVLSSSLPASSPAALTSENERRTRGESSLSTASDLRAVLARRYVGKGVLIVLAECQYVFLSEV